MNHKKKMRLNIKINKIFKEEMDDIYSGDLSEPVIENFNWIRNRDNLSIIEKNNFIKYPFEKWKKIIDEENFEFYFPDKIYQKVVSIILQKEIFRDEIFIEEEYYKNIFYEFITKEKIEIKKENHKNLFNNLKSIHPDFIIKKIDKEKFLKIINERAYMFNPGDNLGNIPKNIKYINIIGEIKLNEDHLNSKQNKRYIEFCSHMNKEENIHNNSFYYYIVVFDRDYMKLRKRELHKDKPMILSYIPQLHKNDCYVTFKKISEELKAQGESNINEDDEINTNKTQDEISDNNTESYKEENKIELPQNKIKMKSLVIKVNKIEKQKKDIDYENLSVSDLLKHKRYQEDKILEIKMEEIKQKQILFEYSRDIEDKTILLKKINYYLNKKRLRDENDSFDKQQ